MNLKVKYIRPGVSSGAFWLFVSPVLLIYCLVFLYPFISTFIYSLTRWNGLDVKKEFVGLANYKRLFYDKRYLNALAITFRFAFFNVILINSLSFFLALMLNSKTRITTIARGMFFLPHLISMVIVGFIWQFIFMNITHELSSYPMLGFLDQGWLGDPKIALYSVVMVSVWRTTGYIMLIYLAGLQTIDKELIDASKVDGATEWKRFLYIIFPLMIPSFNACLFMTIVMSFRTFDLIFALTRGGPGFATEVLSLNIYNEAFGREMYGYGTAKAIVLAVIILIITYLQVKVLKRKEVVL